jgi:hypothetical protein
MTQLEDVVRQTFGERGASVAGVRFAGADVRRRARRIRWRQRAAGATALALLAIAAVVVPQTLQFDQSVPAEFNHSDPAYVDWPARGDRIHDRNLLRMAVAAIDESWEGPHTRVRLLLADRSHRQGRAVDTVVLEAFDGLGRPRIAEVHVEGRAAVGSSYWPAPYPAELTHWWVSTTNGTGLLLMSPRATHVEVGASTYASASGVVEIPGNGEERYVLRSGEAEIARGMLMDAGGVFKGAFTSGHADPPIDAEFIDWHTRGEPAPAPVVAAAVTALSRTKGVEVPEQRALASGRLPDGRVFYIFTANRVAEIIDRQAWFWVSAADGSAGTLSPVEQIRKGENPHLLGWNVDGYVVFVAQPGVRSVEYTTDGGATYRPAPHVEGVGTIEVRGVEVTDAGEVKVRVVDFPGCATYTWTLRQSGIRSEYCDRHADAYRA